MVTRIVDSLGIRPRKIELRRRKFALDEAQVKQVYREYLRLATTHTKMLKVRSRPASAAQRLINVRQRWLDDARDTRERKKRARAAELRAVDGEGS